MKLVLGLLLAVIVPASAHARRPELDTVFWGDLTHNGGQPLRPSFVGEFRVSAWLDGVKIAELTLPPSAPPNPSRYVLKVPMDDGAEPRLPATARGGERVKIKIIKEIKKGLSASTYETHEVNETENNYGLSLTQTKGFITLQNLSLNEDLGGASPILARFAVWRAELDFQPNLLNPDSDSDGDGTSNFAEFLANTDPQSGSSVLRIHQIQRTAGVASIKLGPVKKSSAYTVWSSPTMSADDWQKVGEFTPGADAEFCWLEQITPDATLFYRVQANGQ